jgi:DNA polymerase-3 subunit gamma/tau
VTRTLRNALVSGRLAHAFVFAGPRGVGKTTTARILARALNCVTGPTPDPCGTCDACVEIAEARDIDVLEIDAATHTQVDNVREVIIAGLGIMPVRNRFKVFIIDEVHQLSGSSFNALLKSIEEPPPHVVFMMATTELDKIPETVLSRSQVYEFRTIGVRPIAEQLRKIVDAEGVTVAEEALQLIARDAEGSMRDAQSKLDQVMAFTGSTVGVEDVATVLGLVGRDLLLDAVRAVADEDAPAAFALAARAVEMGYDFRAVCRELSRVVRDMLVLSVDPSRIDDPEIAGEEERERLLALTARYSREDLLRAFDLLTKAEFDIRSAAQPRYHLEMALLRWIYLRKLTPIEDLLALPGQSPGTGTPVMGRTSAAVAPRLPAPAPAAKALVAAPPVPSHPAVASGSIRLSDKGPSSEPTARGEPIRAGMRRPTGDLEDALLAEVRQSKPMLYNSVVAQAQRMEIVDDRITLQFAAAQKMGPAFDKYRSQLEEIATRVAGRRMTAVADHGATGGSAGTAAAAAPAGTPAGSPEQKAALKEQALADAGVRALLEVFPAEIRDVEEM